MKKFTVIAACMVLAACVVNVQDAFGVAVTISNIQKSFDPVNCEVTITWTTDQSTDNNLVKWDNASCQQGPTFPYVEYESGGCKTSHSVTFSVLNATGKKIAFVIESSNSCNSGSSSCQSATSGPCISQ